MNHPIPQLLNEAHTALRQGNLHLAQAKLNAVLHRQPSQIDALLLSANLKRAQMEFDGAREYLKQVLQQNTISINQLKMLAQQLSQLELYFLLAEALKKLSKLEPANAKIWFQLGLCFAKIGKIDNAIEALSKSLDMDSTSHLARLNLGHAYKAKGQSDLAAKQYHCFIKQQKFLQGTGYWSLADLKDYCFSIQDTVHIEQALSKVSIIKNDQKEIALLGFAFARTKEQTKDYKTSLDLLNSANKIIAQARPFKLAGYQHLVNSQLSYKAETACLLNSNEDLALSSADNAVEAHPSPIFIVGMPRSGTTLTEQILASHTSIKCTDELPFIERIAMQLFKGKDYTQGLASISEKQAQHFANYYLDQVSEYTGGMHKMFIDKNPTNFLHIPLIKRLFPHAKIIAMLRDPVDNTMSVYKQHFSQGNDFSFQLRDIVEYTNGYFTLLAHWQKVFPKQIMHLEYQALVTKPELTIRTILDFCEVKFEKQCLEFYKSDRPVLTPSVSQVRQAITTKALGSGTQYLQFLPQFIAKLEDLQTKMKELI